MTILLLIAAIAAAWFGREWPAAALLLGLLALAVAAFAGIGLPDLDLHLPLLDHRDALTHSILPALPALARRWLHPVAGGLALGLGLHLSADVFPEAMVGYATVKLPFAGSIGDWSYGWLLGNAMIGIALFAWLLDRTLAAPVRMAIVGGSACFGLWYLGRVDGGWWAIAVYLGFGAAVWAVRRAVRRARLGVRQ